MWWPLLIAIPILLFALWLHFIGMHSIEGEEEFIHLVYGFFVAYAIAAAAMIWFMPKPNAPSDIGALVQTAVERVEGSP